jgi:hypothetical protein
MEIAEQRAGFKRDILRLPNKSASAAYINPTDAMVFSKQFIRMLGLKMG